MTVPKKSHSYYYPQHENPRLTEDFRIVYDHVYGMQQKLIQLEQQLRDAKRPQQDERRGTK